MNALTGFGVIVAILTTTMDTTAGKFLMGLLAAFLGYCGVREEREKK